MKKFASYLVSFLLTSAFLFIPFAHKTFAQSAFRGTIIDTFLIEIEDTVDPGEVLTRSFRVQHDYQPLPDGSTQVVNIFPSPLDVEQSTEFTEDGDVINQQEYLDIGDLPEQESLASWIETEQDVYVFDEQEEEKVVQFTITVPEDATPGSKTASIFLLNQSGSEAVDQRTEEGFATGLNQAPGVLVVLTVSGEQTLDIEEPSLFVTNAKGNDKDFLFKNFFFSPQIKINLRLVNNGTVNVTPRGQIFVHTGDNYVEDALAIFEIDPTNQTKVLAGGSRTYQYIWDESFIVYEPKRDDNGQVMRNDDGSVQYGTKYDWDNLSKLRLGNFQVTAQYNYDTPTGLSPDQIILSTSFTLFPWHIMVLIAVPTLLLITYIVYRRRKNRD